MGGILDELEDALLPGDSWEDKVVGVLTGDSPINPGWGVRQAAEAGIEVVKDGTPLGMPLRIAEGMDGAVGHVPGGWDTVGLLLVVLLAVFAVRTVIPASWRGAKRATVATAPVVLPHAAAAASVVATRHNQSQRAAATAAAREAARQDVGAPRSVNGWAPLNFAPSVVGTKLKAPDWMRSHTATPGKGHIVDETLDGIVICHDTTAHAAAYTARRRMGWDARQVADEPCDVVGSAKRHVGFVLTRRPRARRR